MPGAFVIQNNCHIRVWCNLSAPPSGSPNYDGPAERLLPANAKLNTWEQRFVLTPTALGISPSTILPSSGNLSYLAIVDDVSGLIAQYWYITDVSLQTVVSSPGNYAVNCVFIECASSVAGAGGVSGFSVSSLVTAVTDAATDSAPSGSDMLPVVVGANLEQLTMSNLWSYLFSNYNIDSWNYPNGDPFVDSSNNVWYSNGNQWYNNSAQTLYMPNGGQLVDINGNIYFAGGSVFATYNGEIECSNGGVVIDANGQLYAPGSSLGPIVQSTGSVYLVAPLLDQSGLSPANAVLMNTSDASASWIANATFMSQLLSDISQSPIADGTYTIGANSITTVRGIITAIT